MYKLENINFKSSYEIIDYIKNSKKSTPGILYLSGKIKKIDFNNIKVFINKKTAIAFGEHSELLYIIENNKKYIKEYRIECSARGTAVPLLDISKVNARIEPGAIIREGVSIGENAIIMMGAVINIGAAIGNRTMIDMNSVIGAKAIIGQNVHVGAGAVVAGVIEPPSEKPVIIEDNVLIGANAVILEGITVHSGAVIGAGAVVTKDVEANKVVVGVPAVEIKRKENLNENKAMIVDELRCSYD